MKAKRFIPAIGIAALTISASLFAKGGASTPVYIEGGNAVPVNVQMTDSTSDYGFVGYTSTDNLVNGRKTYSFGQQFCRDEYGSGARVATGT